MAAAAVLFSGCGEETKKAAGEAATAVKKTAEVAVEETKETTKEVAASAKEKVDEAVEATKEAAAPIVEAAEEKAEEATAAVKEVVSSEETNASDIAADAGTEEESVSSQSEETNASIETEAVTEAAVDNEAGKALYVKCAACHGPDGKTKALGKSAVIAGQSAADIEMKMMEYKAGTRDVAGMGAAMKGQVAGLSDEDIKAVSAYISTL